MIADFDLKNKLPISPAGSGQNTQHSEFSRGETMNSPQTKQKPAQRPGGDVQARVDLQELVKFHLGPGMPGGSCISYQSPFDPDDFGYSWQVFKTHFRDVRNGQQGGAIRFVQRVRRCSYDQAIAYLEGWIHGQESMR